MCKSTYNSNKDKIFQNTTKKRKRFSMLELNPSTDEIMNDFGLHSIDSDFSMDLLDPTSILPNSDQEFNNKSSRFFENFLLNVLVIKNIEKKGDFIIVIKQPTIDFFFDQFLYFDNSCFFLLINEAFDLVKIKSKEFGYNYKRMAFFFFSFLKSTVCKKIKLSLNF